MPFKPQTKRFALVPVEPGKEQITDVELHQDEDGDVKMLLWPSDSKDYFFVDEELERPIIAALGFPTEGEEA